MLRLDLDGLIEKLLVKCVILLIVLAIRDREAIIPGTCMQLIKALGYPYAALLCRETSLLESNTIVHMGLLQLFWAPLRVEILYLRTHLLRDGRPSHHLCSGRIMLRIALIHHILLSLALMHLIVRQGRFCMHFHSRSLT